MPSPNAPAGLWSSYRPHDARYAGALPWTLNDYPPFISHYDPAMVGAWGPSKNALLGATLGAAFLLSNHAPASAQPNPKILRASPNTPSVKDDGRKIQVTRVFNQATLDALSRLEVAVRDLRASGSKVVADLEVLLAMQQMLPNKIDRGDATSASSTTLLRIARLIVEINVLIREIPVGSDARIPARADSEKQVVSLLVEIMRTQTSANAPTANEAARLRTFRDALDLMPLQNNKLSASSRTALEDLLRELSVSKLRSDAPLTRLLADYLQLH